MKKLSTKLFVVLAAGIGLAIPASSSAQNYFMTANDANGTTTSFNGAGSWTSGAAPTAGFTYGTAGYLLRGPDVSGTYTFGGDSLTVGGGNGGGLNPFSPVTPGNNALIFKADQETLNVANLILDGGQIRDGNGNGNNAYLTGNISVTANGGAFMAQDTNWIESAISGSSIIYIGSNGSGNTQRQIIFTSGANTFTGNLEMTNSVNNVTYSQLIFAPGSLWNFVIGANGVNNKIFGQGTIQLNGNFAFDLTGADNTIGDTWDIVDQINSSVTYGSTFSINGFTENGTLWDQIANGVDYDYNTADGILTVDPVPEPATLSVIGLGLAGLVLRRQSKKSAQ